MDKETKWLLCIASIALAAVIILFLLLSGFDLSGFRIYKGIRLS